MKRLTDWISVKDRLPEPSDMRYIGVLVSTKSMMTGRSGIIETARWNGSEWMCKGKEITPRVTHWMPLPEPPTEDKIL